MDFFPINATTRLCFFTLVVWILSYFITCDWNFWKFLFLFFLGIRYPSGDTVVIISPRTDILERPRMSLINFSFLIVITVGCCSLIFLSSELADDIDILVSCFTVSYVLVFEEILYLSNEDNLFSAMSFSISSLIGFSKYESDAFSSFQITNIFLDLIFNWLDKWNIGRHNPLFWFVPFVFI